MTPLFIIPDVLLAIGVLCLSLSCYKANKKIASLERDLKTLTEKNVC